MNMIERIAFDIVEKIDSNLSECDEFIYVKKQFHRTDRLAQR